MGVGPVDNAHFQVDGLAQVSRHRVVPVRERAQVGLVWKRSSLSGPGARPGLCGQMPGGVGGGSGVQWLTWVGP